MCHANCIIFGATCLTKEDIKGKEIIEVGSHDINGSLRPLLESWEPDKYVGVDIETGRGVDIICNAEEIIDKFGKESFDIVVSTELLEHIRDWKKAISDFKNICKPNGIILITTRSQGFAYHGFPSDFWRFELEDMRDIFSDLIIEKLEKDQWKPGVFIKVRKPGNFSEKDLSDYKLYSVVTNKRIKELDDKAHKSFLRREKIKKNIFGFLYRKNA